MRSILCSLLWRNSFFCAWTPSGFLPIAFLIWKNPEKGPSGSCFCKIFLISEHWVQLQKHRLCLFELAGTLLLFDFDICQWLFSIVFMRDKEGEGVCVDAGKYSVYIWEDPCQTWCSNQTLSHAAPMDSSNQSYSQSKLSSASEAFPPMVQNTIPVSGIRSVPQ